LGRESRKKNIWIMSCQPMAESLNDVLDVFIFLLYYFCWINYPPNLTILSSFHLLSQVFVGQKSRYNLVTWLGLLLQGLSHTEKPVCLPVVVGYHPLKAQFCKNVLPSPHCCW
jgi:hypothetical protein